MKKTLVWEILSCLSKKELKALNLFLHSPAFNRREDILQVNRFLSKCLTENKAIPSKEKVFQKAFGTAPYDDKKMGLTLSYLHKVIEDFLWIQEVKNSAQEREKFLITAYRKKKMQRNFSRTLKKTQRSLLNQHLRNPAYYFTQFELAQQKYLSLVETGRTKELNLENVESNLDLAYISTKLQQACVTLSHQSVFNREYESVLFEQIMELAPKDFYKKEPAIALYYEFIILFQKGGIKEFEDFKTELFAQSQCFTEAEFRGLYLLSLNFCIKQVNNNQPAFYAETFDMYKKGIIMGLLLDQGKLTPFSFNNIVGIAIQQGELSWAENFINDYKDALEKAHKMPSVSLNMARVEFAKKKYSQALLYLQKADYEDTINHMTAKILQLKTYYELGEYETLDSFIQSLNALIRRKKRKMGYHYQIWKNILRYIQKVRRVNPYNKKEVEILKNQIIAEKVLPEREWLLSTLEENLI